MAEQDNVAQPSFNIQKIYVKDLSFEAPNTPETFRETWKPAVHIDLDTTSTKIENDLYEVILKVIITAKLSEKVAFMIEAQQAGIFSLVNFATEQCDHFLGSICPNILYPYARETVSDTVMRGGFPQLLLAPINFEALYAQKKAKALETA